MTLEPHSPSLSQASTQSSAVDEMLANFRIWGWGENASEAGRIRHLNQKKRERKKRKGKKKRKNPAGVIPRKILEPEEVYRVG
jgi:hypothetical protein